MLTAQRVPTMHREKGAARAHDVNDVALPRGSCPQAYAHGIRSTWCSSGQVHTEDTEEHRLAVWNRERSGTPVCGNSKVDDIDTQYYIAGKCS